MFDRGDMQVFISCFSRYLTAAPNLLHFFGLHTEKKSCSYRKDRKGAAVYFGLICGTASHRGQSEPGRSSTLSRADICHQEIFMLLQTRE